MAKNKTLRQVVERGKTNEIISYCESQGAEVENGGKHRRIRTERGTTFVTYDREIKANGTRSALFKQLMAIGIRILPFVLPPFLLLARIALQNPPPTP